MSAPEALSTGLAKADHLLDLGRYAEGQRILAGLLAEHPDDAQVLLLLARAHLGLEQPELALSAARAAISAEPEAPSGWLLAGLALQVLDRGDEAVRHGQEGVRLAPEDYRSHLVLARIASKGPATRPLARAAALAAAQRAPEEPETHYVLGSIALTQGDRPTAERAFRQTLALQPDHALASNDLGVVLASRGRRLRAGERFVDSVANDPREAIGQRNLDGLISWFFVMCLSAAVFLVSSGLSAVAFPGLAWRAGGVLVLWLVAGTLLYWRAGPPTRRAIRGFPHRQRLLSRWVGGAALALATTSVLAATSLRSAAVAVGLAFVVVNLGFALGVLVRHRLRSRR